MIKVVNLRNNERYHNELLLVSAVNGTEQVISSQAGTPTFIVCVGRSRRQCFVDFYGSRGDTYSSHVHTICLSWLGLIMLWSSFLGKCTELAGIHRTATSDDESMNGDDGDDNNMAATTRLESTAQFIRS